MSARIRFVIVALMSMVVCVVASAQSATEQQPAKKSDAPGAKAQVYDESADAKEQIAAALKVAARENQRVLIQWGGNWCSWCMRLHELFVGDAAIAKLLSSEYVIIHADAGRNNKNVDLAKSYGAELPKSGYPYLTVLDSAGKPIANQETGSLEKQDASGKSIGVAAGHDPVKVKQFLDTHKPTWPDANEALRAGLERAKSSERVGLVHFRAAWCGWCIRMEEWMARPNIAAILDKAIVDIRIDTERMVGGKELFEKYSGGGKGGIPWFLFVDANGTKIITSDNGLGGNIGYPAKPAEIAHFEAMLKKATKLTAKDIEALVQSLREEGEKLDERQREAEAQAKTNKEK
ncbi:MAG: thioredoxin family protein [Phycisphaerales bacterium]|nr:thioredoxin family protein [Phycisphaerales bacterium]